MISTSITLFAGVPHAAAGYRASDLVLWPYPEVPEFVADFRSSRVQRKTLLTFEIFAS
jgi:hypothetical protein